MLPCVSNDRTNIRIKAFFNVSCVRKGFAIVNVNRHVCLGMGVLLRKMQVISDLTSNAIILGQSMSKTSLV